MSRQFGAAGRPPPPGIRRSANSFRAQGDHGINARGATRPHDAGSQTEHQEKHRNQRERERVCGRDANVNAFRNRAPA